MVFPYFFDEDGDNCYRKMFLSFSHEVLVEYHL